MPVGVNSRRLRSSGGNEIDFKNEAHSAMNHTGKLGPLDLRVGKRKDKNIIPEVFIRPLRFNIAQESSGDKPLAISLMRNII